MRTKVLLAATVFLGAMLGMPPLQTDVGVGVQAAAAKAFYTRKRVNGRWITGRFPKHGAQHSAHRDRAATRDAKADSKRGGRQARSLPEQATPPSPDIQATSAVPARPFAAPLPAAAPVVADERMRQLQQALEAKAKAMAQSLPASPPAPAPTPAKSVTFDFESGVKTMFLSDGTVWEEPFDVAGAQSLGIAAPARSESPDGSGKSGTTKQAQRH